MNAIVPFAAPNTLSPLTQEPLMGSDPLVTVVSALRVLTDNQFELIQALKARHEMMTDLDHQISRMRPAGSEPTQEQEQVRAECYFLESLIDKQSRVAVQVRELVDQAKEILNG